MPGAFKQPVAVYLRISSDDQSHESQRSQVAQWLAREGIDPKRVCWYEDTATGRNLERPAIDRLRDDVGRGRRQMVVVYALDRLSRDFFEGLELLGRWLKIGVRVASVTETIDLSGEIGQAIAGVIFALASAEWRRRRERQAAGIELAKAKGVYKGRKPGATKGKPAKAHAMKRRGLKASEIAATLNVSERTVARYLLRGAGQ